MHGCMHECMCVAYIGMCTGMCTSVCVQMDTRTCVYLINHGDRMCVYLIHQADLRVFHPSRRSSSFQVRIVFMHYVNIGSHVRRPTRISIFFPMSFVAHYAAATTHRHDEIALIFAILVIHYYYLHTQKAQTDAINASKYTCREGPVSRPIYTT